MILPSLILSSPQVLARDFGTPSLSSTVPVSIYVQDVNDHAPQFTQTVYRRAIPEDMPGGTSVLEVCSIIVEKCVSMRSKILNYTNMLFCTIYTFGCLEEIAKLP